MQETRLLELVSLIYESSLQPELWVDALDQLGDGMGSAGGALAAESVERPTGTHAWSSNIDPYYRKLYLDKYIRNSRNNQLYKHLPAFPEKVPFTRKMFYTDEAFSRLEIYHDLFKPQGIFNIASMCLFKDNGHIAFINIPRFAKREDFTADDLRFLEKLAPHLTQALRVQERLSVCAAERDALDRLSYAVLIVDAAGKVRSLNRSAEELVAARDGLALHAARLVGPTPRLTSALRKQISDAARASGGSLTAPGGAMTLPRRPPKAPLSLLIAPLRHARAELGDVVSGAVVFVSDPDRDLRSPKDTLMRMYGLTRAEAALALKLLEGDELASAAELLGVQLSTAKTHLQRIFAKTGVNRQAQLIRLLLKGLIDIRCD